MPSQVVTEAELQRRARASPPEAACRQWVAHARGRVIGWAQASLSLVAPTARVGIVSIARNSGAAHGELVRSLHALAVTHLRTAGARFVKVYLPAADLAGRSVLESFGYHQLEFPLTWAVDPRQTDCSDFSQRRAEAGSAGLVLMPIRRVRGGGRQLYRLENTLMRDVPGHAEHRPPPFRLWRWLVPENPAFDADGSFVVMTGGRPLAMTLLKVHRRSGRAFNYMTGTLPQHRRRGLARLVKTASIEWAVRNGINVIYTATDPTNIAMVSLNQSLGYRQVEAGAMFGTDLEVGGRLGRPPGSTC